MQSPILLGSAFHHGLPTAARLLSAAAAVC
jgi:hypothetical protein